MDESGNECSGQFGNEHRHWWEDDEVQRARLRAQVDIILNDLPGAAVWPPGNTGEVDYLYRAGQILVRDADLDRVLGLVDGVVANALINGVTAVTIRDGDDTQAALATIDARLGVGV